jgi:hypothetical protein
MGRMQPVAAAAGFSVWRAAMLGPTAGLGQKRTLKVLYVSYKFRVSSRKTSLLKQEQRPRRR